MNERDDLLKDVESSMKLRDKAMPCTAALKHMSNMRSKLLS